MERYMALEDRGEWIIWDWEARGRLPGWRHEVEAVAEAYAASLNEQEWVRSYNDTEKSVS